MEHLKTLYKHFSYSQPNFSCNLFIRARNEKIENDLSLGEQVNLEKTSNNLLDLQENYKLLVSTLKENEHTISKLLKSATQNNIPVPYVNLRIALALIDKGVEVTHPSQLWKRLRIWLMTKLCFNMLTVRPIIVQIDLLNMVLLANLRIVLSLTRRLALSPGLQVLLPPLSAPKDSSGTPCITDCVMAELEKLGQKYRVALRIAKDPRFERILCTHKGTYADDCLVERVTQHKCYIVATCDRDLKRRIRKIPGVPIMYITKRKYSIERLPEATIGGD
ncbi:hypothetical protein JHK82_034371 [Glycine max]|nr:hypothetical protein JHK85_035079 [Glycine max]KAG5119951.1 hypothetical protein JHK82_034371 [Glycine max]